MSPGWLAMAERALDLFERYVRCEEARTFGGAKRSPEQARKAKRETARDLPPPTQPVSEINRQRARQLARRSGHFHIVEKDS